jgi:hypothetical protein
MVPLSFQIVHKISIVFFKMFPIAHYFSSHIVWPWFNYDAYNLKREGKGGGRAKGKHI